MRRKLLFLLHALRMLLEENRIEEAKQAVRELEHARWGKRKKKKHRPMEGKDGDGI